MIDLATEQVLPLKSAAAEVRRFLGGRQAHIATLYRWTQSGCRGIKLEYIQVGATRCTSREALARFFSALTRASRGEPVSALATTSAARRRKIEAADRELDARRV